MRVVLRDVVKAFHKMKCSKVAGVDGIAVESLKKGSGCIVDRFGRIFHVCMAHEEDW